MNRKPMSTAFERDELIESVGRPKFGDPNHLAVVSALRDLRQRKCRTCKGGGRVLLKTAEGFSEACCNTCRGIGSIWVKPPAKRKRVAA